MDTKGRHEEGILDASGQRRRHRRPARLRTAGQCGDELRPCTLAAGRYRAETAQGNAPIVTGPKYGKHTADGNISFRNNENPCKSRKPEPCPTKARRTEKPKPCQKRPCPPLVHRHHKKCDIRKNVT